MALPARRWPATLAFARLDREAAWRRATVQQQPTQLPAPPPQRRSRAARLRARALSFTWADAAALLAQAAWASSFPVLKVLLDTVPPLPLFFVRGCIAATLLLAFLALSGRWWRPSRRQLGRLALVGVVSLSLNWVGFSLGLARTTSSHAGLLYSLTPLVVFGLSHLLGHERIVRLDALGLALGVLGVGLIVGGPAGGPAEAGGPTLLGDLLLLGATVCWGVGTLLSAPLVRWGGPLATTAWLTLFGALGLAPVAIPQLLAQDVASWPWQAFAGMAYTGSASWAFGALLWYGAMRSLGAARISIYANMEAVFVVLFSAALLGERVEWTALVGGAAVISGVLLTRRPAS